MKPSKWKWSWRRCCLVIAAIPVALGIFDMLRMESASSDLLFDSVEAIPKNRVGLLLGCVPRLADGRQNPYFVHRIDAAARLYHAHRIEYLLVSGDPNRDGHDEPSAMRRALIERGVPDSRIIIDGRGLRTLDSVLRAKLVYGLQDFSLISQRFHNERAAYIARAAGLTVVGFNARDPDPSTTFSDSARWREPFARVRAVLDVRLLHTQPRFVGERIPIDG